MNIFQVVAFILIIVNVISSEKEKYSNNEELQVRPLNHGEYFPSKNEQGVYDTQFDRKLKDIKNEQGVYDAQFERKLKDIKNEQDAYDAQFDRKIKDVKKFAPEVQGTQFTIIKRTKEVPTTKKVVLARPSSISAQLHPTTVSYSAVHETKIMPVKVIKQGPVKHVYLPEFNNMPKVSRRSSSFPQTYENVNQYQHNDYNSGQFHQNYFRPSAQYVLPAVSGIGQETIGQGYNIMTNGYRSEKSNGISGYGSLFPSGYSNLFSNNIYSSEIPYVPQTYANPRYSPSVASHMVPSYQNGYPYQQFTQFTLNNQPKYTSVASDQYKSYLYNDNNNNVQAATQNIQPQFASVVNNQQSSNSDRQAKLNQVSGLDPELANIVNDVLNMGKGYPTHDGFTMIKSKKDNAIYLIGKPGMSLGTLPNFSAFNYASFQKTSEPDHNKTEEKPAT